jgi:hypothetical protein
MEYRAAVIREPSTLIPDRESEQWLLVHFRYWQKSNYFLETSDSSRHR